MEQKLKNPSDEELCLRVAGGDPQAETELVCRYGWLVRACARPLFLAGGDSEDLIAGKQIRVGSVKKRGLVGNTVIERRVLAALGRPDGGEQAAADTYLREGTEGCVPLRVKASWRPKPRRPLRKLPSAWPV